MVVERDFHKKREKKIKENKLQCGKYWRTGSTWHPAVTKIDLSDLEIFEFLYNFLRSHDKRKSMLSNKTVKIA